MGMSVGFFGSGCHFHLSLQQVRSCHAAGFFAGEGQLCCTVSRWSSVAVSLPFSSPLWSSLSCSLVACLVPHRSFAFVDVVALGRPTHQQVASVRGCLILDHTPASRALVRMTDSGVPPCTANLAHFSGGYPSLVQGVMCIRSTWPYKPSFLGRPTTRGAGSMSPCVCSVTLPAGR